MISYIEKFNDNKFLSALRNGMVMAIPAVMTGVFAILLLNLPVSWYQNFIHNTGNGVLISFLQLLTDCTVNVFVLILIITVSHSYEDLIKVRHHGILTAICLSSYIAFTTDYSQGLSIKIFDKTNLIEGIVILFLVCKLYVWMTSRKLFKIVSYTQGADLNFNAAMSSIFPVIVITGLFAVTKIVIWKTTGISDFNLYITDVLTNLFVGSSRNLASMLEFVFLVHFFWFFGVHGSNLLENVAQTLFVPGIDINQTLIFNGIPPTEIFSKTFLDSFILTGGCGSAICLVIALLLFEKRRNVRSLSMYAFPQVFFNINELIVFGLPIVFNLVMVLPFILVPIIVTLTTYAAMYVHLVPYCVHHVDWTTPVFISGYIATGSFAGSVLQLFNLIIGVICYAPFVYLAQKQYAFSVKKNIDAITSIVKKAERDGKPAFLNTLTGSSGAVCKMLTMDLKSALKNGTINVFYQPQMHYDNTITGFEALLRWNYHGYGYLYPPLIIELAEEAEILDLLAETVTEKTCADIEKLQTFVDTPITISVNYNAKQITNPHLAERIKQIRSRYISGKIRLGIEITEQSVLSSSNLVNEQLSALKQMGVAVIMDDFGMGHSSMMYLQNNHFDEIKLDGSLVRDLAVNPRCKEIITSIVYLSKSLGFKVLAEYVDSEEQRNLLHSLGCDYYQGWFYSPALPYEKAAEYIRKKITEQNQTLIIDSAINRHD